MFDNLYHDISFRIVHLKLHTFLAIEHRNTVFNSNRGVRVLPHTDNIAVYINRF